MFGRKRKHLDILIHRRNATVYLDGRYIHIDVKLSIKSDRDRSTLRDIWNAVADAVALEENPIARSAITEKTPDNDKTFVRPRVDA